MRFPQDASLKGKSMSRYADRVEMRCTFPPTSSTVRVSPAHKASNSFSVRGVPVHPSESSFRSPAKSCIRGGWEPSLITYSPLCRVRISVHLSRALSRSAVVPDSNSVYEHSLRFSHLLDFEPNTHLKLLLDPIGHTGVSVVHNLNVHSYWWLHILLLLAIDSLCPLLGYLPCMYLVDLSLECP
jgi:hypothetical protein